MSSEALAKVVWEDSVTGERQEYVLTEGATASIGRSSNNDIQIAERHVSRQHAVIRYRDGIFMITDLGSSNGTFVNDEKVMEPFPLFAGDEIRLYVPLLHFAALQEGDEAEAQKTGRLISPTDATGQGSLIVTNGPQEGQTFALQLNKITVGRAVENANWEIGLLDPSVSRPHAQLNHVDQQWYLHDLGSSNGTSVNGDRISINGLLLHDGDTITMGGSILLFRSGWKSSHEDSSDLPTIGQV